MVPAATEASHDLLHALNKLLNTWRNVSLSWDENHNLQHIKFLEVSQK